MHSFQLLQNNLSLFYFTYIFIPIVTVLDTFCLSLKGNTHQINSFKYFKHIDEAFIEAEAKSSTGCLKKMLNHIFLRLPVVSTKNLQVESFSYYLTHQI